MEIPYDNIAEIAAVYYMPSEGVATRKYGDQWSVSAINWAQLDITENSTMEVKVDKKNGANLFNATLNLILARQDPAFWESIGTPSLFLVCDKNEDYWLVIQPSLASGKLSFAGFNGRTVQLESVRTHPPLMIAPATIWAVPQFIVQLVPITGYQIYQGEAFQFGLKVTNLGTIPIIDSVVVNLEGEFINVSINV